MVDEVKMGRDYQIAVLDLVGRHGKQWEVLADHWYQSDICCSGGLVAEVDQLLSIQRSFCG